MMSEDEKRKARKERDRLQVIREAILERAWADREDEGTTEIDEDAIISMGEEGAYVQGWLYVGEDEVQLSDECYSTLVEAEIGDWPSDCANPVTPKELEDALRALLEQFKISYSADSHNNPQAKAAAIVLARIKGIDLIEDQTCYLADDL